MALRSYLASLFLLVVVANPARAWAQPVPPSQPVFVRAVAYPYQEGWPVPPGYHLESRSRKGLVWAGAAVFGSFYALPIFIAAGKNAAAPWLLVPIAGPQLFASHQTCEAPCDDIGMPLFMMMFTAGQATGAALFTAGFLAQKEWVVPDSSADGLAPRVVLVPRVDRSGAAVVVLGVF